MFETATRYAEQFARLRTLIQKTGRFAEARELALELHALTHCAAISGSATPLYEDTVLEGLAGADFAATPTRGDFPVAWHLWHITRIEDLVGNMLINDAPQVFDAGWAGRMQITVADTGNAMNAQEARAFSERLNVNELKQYRCAVGLRTRETLAALSPADMRRKPTPRSLDRLVAEGGLTEHKASLWLRNFWGQKTVGGLVLLPLTRHQLMHLEPIEAMKASLSECRSPRQH